MARKNKNKIVLEDVELKPQVIGYTYKKKSNIIRVVIILAIFIAVVYYINDISVFINNLLGKESASTIKDNKEGKKDDEPIDNIEKIYSEVSDSLTIEVHGLKALNFKYENKILSFELVNESSSVISLKDNKIFLELFTDNKTLLERFKVDIDELNKDERKSYAFETQNDFKYISFEEKTTNDYPHIELTDNKLVCTKDIDTIEYHFSNDLLTDLVETIRVPKVNPSYTEYYNTYKDKTNKYKNTTGLETTFVENDNNFIATISANVGKVNTNLINEKHYFKYNEEAKVVAFEMSTYGYTCK